jgi:photosystem II stability/assembly factor-like uncharacterized protein
MKAIKRQVFQKVIGLILLVFSFLASPAGNLPPQTKRMSPVITNNVLTSSVAQVPASTATDAKVTNLITLGVNPDDSTFIPALTDVKVTLLIQSTTAAGAQPPVTKILEIKINPFTGGTPYLDKATEVLNGVYTSKVTVLSIVKTTTSATGVVTTTSPLTLPSMIYIDNEIDVERYYNFPSRSNSVPVDPIIMNPYTFVDLDCDGVNDEVQVSWPVVTGAEEYQLEWSYVNDYDVTPHTYLPTSALNYDFKNNSTRITTTNTNYNITLAFEHGYLLYRVRAIGRSTTSPFPIITGKWSQLDAGIVSSLPVNNTIAVIEHEGVKNWQFSATYAEEGKKKEVVSYFDGSLRNRQTVTKMNSGLHHNTIVGETIYDFQGRPAVNVLPVPAIPSNCSSTKNETAIHYYPNFNLDTTSTASTPVKYSRKDFDMDAVDSCHMHTAGMDPANGASNYYSSSNPDKNGAQAFLPDAQKRPFTQMEYTPDNTGRVRRQGGVGPDHQLNSDHETKYIYGNPDQILVDRLFGSEAGDAAHYKINTVIDANGQASNTYLDQEGRTIATSLAGNSHFDAATQKYVLDTIPGYKLGQKTLTSDLFSSDAQGRSKLNALNSTGDALIFSKQIAVSFGSDYLFNYGFSVDTVTAPCNTICMSCVYNLDFEIRNDCGQLIVPYAASGLKPNPFVEHVGHFSHYLNTDSILSFITSCSATPDTTQNAEQIKVHLDPGNYTVNKVLTVNKQARDFYLDQYLKTVDTVNCVKTFHHFVAASLAGLDTTSCAVNCSRCAQSLGTKESFVAAGKGTDVQYDFLIEQCNIPCKAVSMCDMQYQMMLADMSPGGQYAQYLDSITHAFNPNLFPLSVLNENNSLPKNVSHPIPAINWRNPDIDINNVSHKTYIDGQGNQAIIHLTQNLSGTYTPAVAAGKPVFPDGQGGFYTYPQYLANVTDFISAWQPQWARSLVKYHPEYCYYSVCQKLGIAQSGDKKTSDDFDGLMMEDTTFAMALQDKLVNGNYLTNVIPTQCVPDYFTKNPVSPYDPFTTATGSGSVQSMVSSINIHNLMQDRFLHYITVNGQPKSMVEVAAVTARCGTMYGSNSFSSGGTPTLCEEFGHDYTSNSVSNDKMRNKEWNLLVGFYRSEKLKILKQVEDAYSKSCEGFNACIGNSGFDPQASGFMPSVFPTFSTTLYNDPNQPCSRYTAQLYIHKRKRFVDQNDVPNSNQNDVAYQMYLQTGQCPVAVQLQGLLTALAQNQKLTSAVAVSLVTYPQFTPDLYNFLNNNASTGGTTPFGWQAVTSSGNVLSGNFVNMNTHQGVCSLSMDKTGTTIVSWTDVTGFQNLKANGGLTGAWNFNALVSGSVGNNVVYKPITGVSCYKLDGCGFTDECKPNQFATDMSTLMTVLAANNKLIGSNVNLATSPYSAFVSPAIQNALGTSSTALTWNYASNSKFTLSTPSSSQPVSAITIQFTGYTPSTFSAANISNIKQFSGMNSNYNNQFKIKGQDASGVQIVSIDGNTTLVVTNSGTIVKTSALAMGTCALPTPLNCTGDGYTLAGDLLAVLKDELLKSPFSPNINIYTSPAFTPLLKSYLPSIDNSSTGVLTSVQKHDTLSETLTIHFHPNDTTCSMVLRHTNKALPTYQNGSFSNLTSLSAIVGRAPQDENGNYNGFYCVATYLVTVSTNGRALVRDTIFGQSCVPLLNCVACPLDNQASVQRQLPAKFASMPDAAILQYMDSTRLSSGGGTIDSNQVQYAKYTTRLASVNTRMGWQPTDTAYVAPIDYLTFYTGNFSHTSEADSSFMTYYNPKLDSKSSLRSLSQFVQTSGNHQSPERLYRRYVTAVTQYNQRASTFTGAIQLTILPDSAFFDSLLVDGINLYISYLTQYPLAGQNPKTELAFRAQQGSIPLATDSCVILYRQYLRAYKAFTQRQQTHTTCESYTRISPMFSYGDFVENNFCCSPAGYTAFRSYTLEFSNPALCPSQLPKVLSCSTPDHDIKECQRMYQLYLDFIRLYNGSPYALFNHHQLNNSLFASFDIFHTQGFCYCVSTYLEYLSPYITASANATLQVPVSIYQYPGCTRTNPDYNCNVGYFQLNAAIKNFNASGYAAAHHDSLVPFANEKEFFAAGFCNCVENYVNYVNSFTYAAASASMGNPLPIGSFTGCPGTTVPSNPCADAYEQYVLAVAQYTNTKASPPLPPIRVIYTKQTFIDQGYCYCLSGFIAGLQAIENGSITGGTDKIFTGDIALTCETHRPPCTPNNPPPQVPSPAYTKHDNPCGKMLLNMALENAQNAYNKYLDSLKTDISNRYMSHCLGAKEKLTDTYDDKEYHFTLYYYDQAGNLVRTIPPEGVSMLNVRNSTDPVEMQIIQDRTSGSHTVFTNHNMATTYEYNSLNQLVKQSVPDHDMMNIFEYQLPNGLVNNLVVTSTQFVSANKGYLTGYVPGTPRRGYLYTSSDGGNTWQKLYDVVASDLSKVQMNGNSGLAVGRNGVVLFTNDGGQNWDMTPTYNLANGDSAVADANLNDVVLTNTGGGFNGLVVGSSGAILQVSGLGSGTLTYQLPFGYTPNHAETFTSVTFDNNVFYASGYDVAGAGFIYRSDGNGNNFTKLTNYTATDLVKVTFIRSGITLADSLRGNSGQTGFAAGIDGSLLKTKDGGQNWFQINTGQVRNFRDIYFRNGAIGVAIIDSMSATNTTFGLLWKTADGGHTWARLGKKNEYYTSLYFYNRDNGIAVGKGGLIKRIVTNTSTSVPYCTAPYFGLISVQAPSGSAANDLTTVAAVEVPTLNPTRVYAITAGTLGGVYYTGDLAASSVSWTDATAAGNLTGSNPIITADLPFKNVMLKVDQQASGSSTFNLIRASLVTTGTKNLFSYIQNLSGNTVNSSITRPGYPVVTPNFVGLVPDNTGANFYTVSNSVSVGNKTVCKVAITGANTASVAVSTSSQPFAMATPSSLAVLNQGSVQKVTVVGTKGEIASTLTNINANPNVGLQTKNMRPLPIYDLEMDGNVMYTSGADGSILVRAANGSDFSWVITNNADKLNAIRFIANSTPAVGLEAGDKGVLYKLSISGNVAGLTQITTNTAANLNDIAIGTNDVYVTGDAGAMFRINNLSTNPIATPVSTNAATTNFKGIALYQSGGNTGAFAVGSNSAIFNVVGLSNGKVKTVYSPSLKDVNFIDINEGYLIGDMGTIRHTSNAGVTWNVVAPEIYIKPAHLGPTLVVPQYNSVWTTSPGHVLIAGNRNYLAQTNSGGSVRAVHGPGTLTYDYILPGTANQNWNDIAFGKVIKNNGFVVGDGKQFLSLTNVGGLVTVSSQQTASNASGPVLPATADFHALYMFNDNRFMAVGTNNLVAFYTGSGNGFYLETNGISTTTNPTFNDVFFHDDRNGYVVGNGGVFYSCSTPCNMSQQSAQTVLWTRKGVNDGFNISNPQDPNVDINVITFPSRYYGFIAGNYSNSEKNAVVKGQQFPYARLLHDESGLFSTFFFYDRLGRLVVSQNTKQFNKRLPTIAYSYTLYDDLGRIVEVGEKAENGPLSGHHFQNIFGTLVNNFFNPKVISDDSLHAWIFAQGNSPTVGGDRTEVTHTFYDVTAITGLPFTQDNLRKRVASVTFEDLDDGDPQTFESATHYSYDIHGNVKTLVQDNQKLLNTYTSGISTQRFKRTDYDYDLISGKVNMVSFQQGQHDQFYHRYTYDSDNRITLTETSHDNVIWDVDAKYFYYAHGPLSRTEIGNNKIQGVDYAYTLQGWIKGVNSNALNTALDMGKDADQAVTAPANNNKKFARDAFGYTLSYNSNDYAAIDPSKWSSVTSRFEADKTGSDVMKNRFDLYNGNISMMATTITKPVAYTNLPNIQPDILPLANAYQYDQLNRLVESRSFKNTNPLASNNTWDNTASAYNNLYKNRLTYDANGNIITQTKYDSLGVRYDSLKYQYQVEQSCDPLSSNTVNRKTKNRLYSYHDADPSNYVKYDLDDPNLGTFDPQSLANANYGYDEIGNLISDQKEEILNIKWSVYGKIKEITRTNGSQRNNLKFDYDPSGNRIAKHVLTSTGVWKSSTYYVLDGQGNVMATYKHSSSILTGISYMIKERDIYGSSRLGIDATPYDLTGSIIPPVSNTVNHFLGDKNYEFSNHLGNVLAVVSDKKIPRDDNSDGLTDYYQPDLVSSTDYYGYGQELPGRHFNSSAYEIGFNSQRKENEICPEVDGDTYSATFWEYNPRLGVRWNLDPKPTIGLSDYSTFAGNPIWHNDPLGDKLDVGTDEKSKSDVSSVVSKDNRKYVKFDDKGHVTLDFGKLDKKQQDLIINKDEGLKLVRDLVVSDCAYLYEASEVALIRNESRDKTVMLTSASPAGIMNASNYGYDSNEGNTYRPKENYDGQVVINPRAEYWEPGGDTGEQSKTRSSIVFHELTENYERTNNGVKYNGENGAHNRAIKREQKWEGRSHRPGQITKWNEPKRLTGENLKKVGETMKTYLGK